MATALEEVLAEPMTSVVGQLVDILGGPTVAVIGGVTKTSAVGEWMRGQRAPRSEDREMRLRLALQVALTIKERPHTDKTVRAWFLGANQRLNDSMPVTVIASSEDLGEMQRSVLEAARGFVSK